MKKKVRSGKVAKRKEKNVKSGAKRSEKGSKSGQRKEKERPKV